MLKTHFVFFILLLNSTSAKAVDYFAENEAKISFSTDENHLVEIQFETYIENILGFRSKPSNDEENFKWKTLQFKWFKENSNFITLPKSCIIEESEIEYTNDKRSTLMASVLFQCRGVLKIGDIKYRFFEQFPDLNSLEVSIIDETVTSKRIFKKLN